MLGQLLRQRRQLLPDLAVNRIIVGGEAANPPRMVRARHVPPSQISVRSQRVPIIALPQVLPGQHVDRIGDKACGGVGQEDVGAAGVAAAGPVAAPPGEVAAIITRAVGGQPRTVAPRRAESEPTRKVDWTNCDSETS